MVDFGYRPPCAVRDRKTVRAHLLGERAPGERTRVGADPFDGVRALCSAASDR